MGEYYDEMYSFLRNELGVKVPITGHNNPFATPDIKSNDWPNWLKQSRHRPSPDNVVTISESLENRAVKQSENSSGY